MQTSFYSLTQTHLTAFAFYQPCWCKIKSSLTFCFDTELNDIYNWLTKLIQMARSSEQSGFVGPKCKFMLKHFPLSHFENKEV